MEIYTENKVHKKLEDGLHAPFETTIELKQGCVFSPLLFNLYVNKIDTIFDETCNPI